MSQPILNVKDVYAGYYKGIDILKGVSMEVKKNTTVCIIGPNGAGKSTLIKTIYGFIKPRKGEIVFNGNIITGKAPFEVMRMGISYVPQEKGIFPHMSVEENLMLGGWVRRNKIDELEDGLNYVLDMFPNLKAKRDMKAGLLSGGEQKMVEVGRALMLKPKMIIFDEPTAGLAPKLMNAVYNVIKKLQDEGLTILMIDQNIKHGISISDYVYVLELGKITYRGPREKVEAKLKDIIKNWLGF